MTPKKPLPKLHELEQKYQDEHDARLRLAAEFANFQRRTEQDFDNIKRSASAELLAKIFPVFDNFYRLANHAPDIDPANTAPLGDDQLKKITGFLSGLKQIESQMEQVLIEAGLEKIPTIGLEFDPNLHEAISLEPSDTVPTDSIIAEVESGWLLNNQVLKPAKVRVSKG